MFWDPGPNLQPFKNAGSKMSIRNVYKINMGNIQEFQEYRPPFISTVNTLIFKFYIRTIFWILLVNVATRNISQWPWWRHQMETFSALQAICAGNSPVTGEFPAQRPVTRSFDVFFDRRLNKRLRKQSWGWWFERLSRPLWRHCNDQCKNWNSNMTKHWRQS